jgi:hypothetical protein
MAPARFPASVAANVPIALACPRAAMKLPNATTVSAGSGGKTFSAAAVTASAR